MTHLSELRQLRADIDTHAANIHAVFGEMKRSVRPVTREESQSPYSEDAADEAIAEDIFRSSGGSRMRSEINRPLEHAPRGTTRTESRALDHQAVSTDQESDEALADDIFRSSGNTGSEHSHSSMEDAPDSGDDEDTRLANEIFECAGSQG